MAIPEEPKFDTKGGFKMAVCPFELSGTKEQPREAGYGMACTSRGFRGEMGGNRLQDLCMGRMGFGPLIWKKLEMGLYG